MEKGCSRRQIPELNIEDRERINNLIGMLEDGRSKIQGIKLIGMQCVKILTCLTSKHRTVVSRKQEEKGRSCAKCYQVATDVLEYLHFTTESQLYGVVMGVFIAGWELSTALPLCRYLKCN
ncbi:hypothetical protein WN51_08227 [Melipona quadrifasciata]|uniref:Uncharacterized protein n=1 Tax=Melipona quadrifasciata TaxID=166423 RepID=A0A0N1ISY5_9HYME|nr:hypothetical protein WN51_08227 [Melipona quadrifasciata]